MCVFVCLSVFMCVFGLDKVGIQEGGGQPTQLTYINQLNRNGGQKEERERVREKKKKRPNPNMEAQFLIIFDLFSLSGCL